MFRKPTHEEDKQMKWALFLGMLILFLYLLVTHLVHAQMTVEPHCDLSDTPGHQADVYNKGGYYIGHMWIADPPHKWCEPGPIPGTRVCHERPDDGKNIIVTPGTDIRSRTTE